MYTCQQHTGSTSVMKQKYLTLKESQNGIVLDAKGIERHSLTISVKIHMTNRKHLPGCSESARVEYHHMPIQRVWP